MKTKRKRVGTLTFHIAHNYGAMLQAHALQQTITRLGGDCEIIDYRFPYINQWSGIWTWSDLCRQSGVWRGTLRYMKRCYTGYYRRCTRMQKKFNAFMRRMRLSREVYFSREQLIHARYDFVVTGSDQIWNPNLTNGPAKEYFGQCFDLNQCQLVSYAASNGKDSLPVEFADQMLEWLKKYKVLGIREKALADTLNNNHFLRATPVLDPVFLCSPDEWKSLATRASIRIEEPYLLLYAFQVGSEIYDLARQVARERGLKLVSIQYKYDESLSDMQQCIDCGPEDFVSLFQHADFVCTSSFHGNVFAIIFEKDFYCVGHPEYSQRNRDMLQLFGLKHRYVQGSVTTTHSQPVDYEVCRQVIQKEVERSCSFLVEALQLKV